METSTATPTATTAIALTPDTLQAIARLIAAVEKITMALDRIDSTITLISEQQVKHTEALEQIQLYLSDR
jgi:hypothetical protein